jgi:TATA-binding protein-associated factor
LFTGKVNPSDKVIKNLWTFLCQDTSITPVFSPTAANEGIVSLREDRVQVAKRGAKDVPEETEEQIAMRVTRRGALEAFRALAGKFGKELLDEVPKFWEGISAAFLANFADGA